MNTPRFLAQLVIEPSLCLAALLGMSCAGEVMAADALEQQFVNPPVLARPTLYYIVGETELTLNGITKDFEAYKAAGFGGVIWVEMPFSLPAKPIRLFSKEWTEGFRQAVREAKRLNLRLEVDASSGYCTGGPWITPEFGLQKVIASEVRVSGKKREVVAPKPAGVALDSYRDIAVLAFRAPTGARESDALPRPAVRVANASDDGMLTDGNDSTGVLLKAPVNGAPLDVVLEYPQPVTARSLRISIEPGILLMEIMGFDKKVGAPGLLEASEDGVTYRRLADLPVVAWNWKRVPHYERTISFPATKARYFRARFDNWNATKPERMLYELTLSSAARTDRWEEKTGYDAVYPDADRTPAFPPDACVSRATVLDLTDKMGLDGRLDWSPPVGEWIVLRLGHTPTGENTLWSIPGGGGLECDKMSREATDLQYKSYVGPMLKIAREESGTVAGIFEDSCEYGPSNWTPVMREEFRGRRGYDALPWLPALRGYVVDNVAATEKFLADFRLTLADLMADNHFGRLTEVAHRDGMTYTGQAPGASMGVYANMVQCEGRCDMPQAEFWNTGMPLVNYHDNKDAACGAHLYGHPVVMAEALTGAKWYASPENCSPFVLEAFCNGINRLNLLGTLHQPWDDAIASQASGRIRVFNRHNTWWPMSGPWWASISRACALLQSGLSANDLCYFMGDDAPARLFTYKLQPPPPPGFEYDVAPGEIVRAMKVRNGLLVAPGGAEFHALVVPDGARVTGPTQSAIDRLAKQGALVIAVPPQVSTDAPNAISEALSARGFGPDIRWETMTNEAKLRFVHRRTEVADIYFVANLGRQTESFVAAFRVVGRAPEFWDSDNGCIAPASSWEDRDGYTHVTMQLPPQHSRFVIFRSAPGRVGHWTTLSRDGVPVGGSLMESANGPVLPVWDAGNYQAVFTTGERREYRIAELPRPIAAQPDWTVEFPPGRGAPPSIRLERLMDLTQHPDFGVRHFSGIATWRGSLVVPEAYLREPRPLQLDLGGLTMVASVRLNGEDLGVVWQPPFRLDVTGRLKPGTNTLEIQVATSMANRWIADAGLPVAQRVFKTNDNPHKPTDPLAPAGLVGPVTVRAGAMLSVR